MNVQGISNDFIVCKEKENLQRGKDNEPDSGYRYSYEINAIISIPAFNIVVVFYSNNIKNDGEYESHEEPKGHYSGLGPPAELRHQYFLQSRINGGGKVMKLNDEAGACLRRRGRGGGGGERGGGLSIPH